VLDLLVTIPHVLALIAVVGWLVYAKRFSAGEGGGDDERRGGGGQGGGPTSQPPRVGRHASSDELARSA
jgi:hypothetical protein